MASWTSQRTGNWSTDASNPASPWNGGSNPASGVPANTDTITTTAGHTITYDYDMTAFANGVTLVNNGTLEASQTAGSYVLKLAANMTGSGTLRAGTSGTPYPTNCTFEIQRGSFSITATTMTLDLNCSEPPTKYIRLSGVEAIGQTILSIDTDVTAQTSHWKNGAIVRICDVNFGYDNEERIIATGGVAAGTITVTAGLTAQKETDSFVVLISRNVKITGTTGTAISSAVSGRIFAEVRTATTGFNAVKSCEVGGTLSGCATGFSSVSSYGCAVSASVCGNTISGFADVQAFILSGALVVGNVSGFNACIGFIIDSTSVIAGSTNGFLLSNNMILLGCSVFGNTTGVSGGSVKAINATLNNTTDVSALADSSFYNCAFNGTTEFGSYATSQRNITAFAESINHDAQAGAYKAWVKGGIVTKQSSVYPTGYTSSQLHACESATYPVFQNYSVTVPAGGGLVVQTEITKDTAMSYLPRVWILLPGVEPLISGSASYEGIITQDMTSTSTWETVTLVYANSTTAPATVTVRTVAKNATGNVYFYPVISVLSPATYDVYNTLLGYVDSLESRLTATRAGYLDNLAAGAVALQSSVDDLEGRLTSTRAGYLDNLTNLDAAISSRLASAGYTAPPTAAQVVAELFSTTAEGRAFIELFKDVWAQVVGDFSADDADEPGTIAYDGPDGTTQITHTLTDTTRSWS